jgi:hypothetical protein
MNLETPAERLYKRHLTYVKNYQKNNKEKTAEKCKRYNDKVKTERPEKYEEVKQRRKDYYQNVIKPKKNVEKVSKVEN